MNRRQKIFNMLEKLNLGKTETVDLPEGNLVFLPSYETTNGLSPKERQCAIDEYRKTYPIEDITFWDSVSEDKTSGSEYCPSSSYDSNEASNHKHSQKKYLKRKLTKKIRKKALDKNKKTKNSNKEIRILQNIRIENVKIKESEQTSSDAANQLGVGSNKENVYNVEDKSFLIEKYLHSIQDNNEEKTSQIDRTIYEENQVKIKDKKNYVTIPKKKKDKKAVINIQESEKKFENEEPRNKKQSEVMDSIGVGYTNLTSYETPGNEPTQEHNERKNERISKESSGKNTSDESFNRTFRVLVTGNNIEIVAAGHKTNGKRVRNKTHVCYFCNKKIINMARHFETIHGHECEVAKYLAYPKNSKQRRQGFIEIIRIGDFYHNCNVMATKNGELVLIRRPTENEAKHVSDSDYGPCPNCLGFLLKKHIWHHVKHTCKEKITLSGDTTSRHVIAESNAIMADIFGIGFTKEYNDSILSNFKSDAIGDICRNDFLIMKFGAMQFEKYGNTQCEFIRQTMRQLGRLSLALKEISNDTKIKSLSDFLIPQKFDTIVQATKHVCNVMTSDVTSRPEFKTPSLALKIGYALKKCVSIERGVALRAGNIKRNEALVSFLHLMEMEWNIRISSNALSTLYKRKLNATQLLPITSDLVKLNKYIDSEISKYKTIVESKDRNNNSWTRLATFVLARVILFNKRRSGEAAKMKMTDFISRPCWKEQNTEEIQKSLTSIERKLAETLCIVEIEGKRGRKVPVILTPLVKDSIDILIRHRDECNIYLHNKYIFARSHQSVSFLRGHDCLQKICGEIDLENPKLITSTKLRKYIATVCQLFNMSENEYDWLARHLGHDIRVHREFYRLHESAVELTKVSRLLIAVDQGEANKFAGKHIEDIELKELPNLEEDEEEKEDKDLNDEDFDDERDDTVEEAEIRSFPGTSDTAVKTKTGKKPKKAACPQPWSQCEREAAIEFFKQHIKKSIIPKQQDCLNCIKENPALANRPWKKLKYFVKNQIDKNKKMCRKK